MYTVYCHIFPNGKRYIGATKAKLKDRWNHGRNYKRCPLMHSAIKEFGWENVAHEILATARTKEEADKLEREYIRKYNSDDKNYGYNILPGGDVSNNAVTDEMRIKLGNGWRGKNRTEEEKKSIGAGVRKVFERPESNGHIGTKHTEETKAKMSISGKNAWNNDERRRKAAERMKKRYEDPEYKRKTLERLRESHNNSAQSF